MDKNTPLRLHNLSKLYGGHIGVKDVSMELQLGEVFGFLGPNGAGKSTTIRTILNFIRPTSGSVVVYGLDSVIDSVAIKNKVGYLAGNVALYDNMKGRDILKFLTSLGRKTDWQYVDELANRLEANLEAPMHRLSKGNIQKIGLIQAFMHKPSLLILDEPTSGLDPLMKQVFYEMVLEAKGEGRTVFVSSHDLTEVQKICDRAGFIRDGELIGIEDIQSTKALNIRRFRATFEIPPDKTLFSRLKSTREVLVDGNTLTVTVVGSMAEFIGELAKHHPLDLVEQETSLEDLFMHYYRRGK